MPRISQALISQARRIHPLLPLLLRQCRDLRSARLELSWLQDHVWKLARQKNQTTSIYDGTFLASTWNQKKLEKLCKARFQGVPLQYILGTEFFGDLELRCRPGVLIPRQATASMVLNLLDRIQDAAKAKRVLPKKLKLLDLCSGTGCISLLTASAFPYEQTGVEELEVMAVDISSRAIDLARENQQKVLKEMDWSRRGPRAQLAVENTQFIHADLLQPAQLVESIGTEWDIVISNPPYISPHGYLKSTARSVRSFEPKLALVPPAEAKLDDNQQADLFYPLISRFANNLRAKLLLVEVGDMQQAERVASHYMDDGLWSGTEIWKDDPRNSNEKSTFGNIKIIGEGEGRSIFCWKDEAKPWVFPQ